MAAVGAVYSNDRFKRSAADVVDEVCRKASKAKTPRPCHKQMWAEITRHPEDEASHRLQMLLEGKVGYVIGGLRRRYNTHRLKGEKRRRVAAAITYYENNREHMRYDEYLQAGYPIGSGVAEGACRHLVRDRMERTGIRWTVAGAQAMLHLRALYLNGRWDGFIDHHIQTEQTRQHRKTAA